MRATWLTQLMGGEVQVEDKIMSSVFFGRHMEYNTVEDWAEVFCVCVCVCVCVCAGNQGRGAPPVPECTRHMTAFAFRPGCAQRSTHGACNCCLQYTPACGILRGADSFHTRRVHKDILYPE